MDLGRESLEEDVPALIARADRAHTESRGLRITANAAAAIEKALAMSPDDAALEWRFARAYLTLANAVPSQTLGLRFARQARMHAMNCGTHAPELPACAYFEAAAAGIAATLNPSAAAQFQQDIEAPAERLVELDASYERGGGLRILGALYARAPAWPAGVGDLEEGVELLERAAREHPGHPLNHFFLAEAYARSGQIHAATLAYRAVLEAPVTGEWNLIGAPYRGKAQSRLEALTRELAP